MRGRKTHDGGLAGEDGAQKVARFAPRIQSPVAREGIDRITLVDERHDPTTAGTLGWYLRF